MHILLIISVCFQFFGAIWLSIDFIKSKKQIEDETAIYWDENPYLREYSLQEKNNIEIGFVFVISGFALQIAITLTNILSHAILLSLFLIIIGLIFFRYREKIVANRHLKIRKKINTKVFIDSIKAFIAELEKSKQQFNTDKDYFTQRKQNFLKQMKNINEVDKNINDNFFRLFETEILIKNNVDEVVALFNKFIENY